MKAPDTVLVRARAKAPVADLQALHLSHADLACLRNLEPCRQLRSLYANANVLKDIEGIAALRRLWRIDLSDNLLRQVRPLASFSVLGFLNLERNQLGFEDLVCLRDVHILDLRLTGNRDLLAQDHNRAALVDYRMKIIALLPYVWSLDGHFVTTREREQALEAFDDFALDLLARRGVGNDSSLRFGSSSDVWGGFYSGGDDLTSPVQEDTLKLLKIIEKQPTRHPEKQDLHRLRALAAFYDSDSDVHNAHTQFAPQKHAANAKPQPKPRLSEFLRLSSRVQLELCVVLTAHLDFPLPTKVLTDALTIALLGEEDKQSAPAVEDLAQLPPYAIVALISVMRLHVLDEHNGIQRNRLTAQFARPFDVQMWKSLPTVVTRPFDVQMWKSLPTVVTTLLESDRQRRLLDVATPDQFYVQRCAFAVSLLSRATSFPEKPAANACGELVDLIEAAKLASTSSLESIGFTIPRVLLADDSSAIVEIRKKSIRNPEREYRRPWNEKPPAAVLSELDLETSTTLPRRTRAPRPGEWLEIRPKLHLKIRSVSADGVFLSASTTSGTETSQLLTVRTDQVLRVSSSMWRLVDDDPVLLDDCLRQLGLGKAMARGRLGKLHRDSDAFHKHGAMRNQGYSNRDVSTRDLRRASIGEEDRTAVASVQPQPLEVFGSTDTLDSNYVLTSPALISVQNAVAIRAFQDQGRAPAGLWNTIQTASFQLLPASNDSGNNASVEKPPKAKSKNAGWREQHDEWLELRRDMQALLGIQGASDADCFMTSESASEPVQEELTCNKADGGMNSPPRLSHSASSPSLISQPSSPPLSIARSTAKPKKLAAISWRQVPTKPQLLVAASVVPASPLAAKLGQSMPTALSDPLLEAHDAPLSSRPWSSSSRTPLQLARCQVSLPTLALLGANQK